MRYGRRWPPGAIRTYPGYENNVLGVDATLTGVAFVSADVVVVNQGLFADADLISAAYMFADVDIEGAPPPPPVPGDVAEHKVIVRDRNGVPMEEIDVKNLQYSDVLNDAGAISFTLNKYDPKCTKTLLDPGRRELVVLRNGQTVWGGYLWVASPTDDDEIRFGGEGWFSRFSRRYISNKLEYNQVDQARIAWDLIDYTQNKPGGDLGIRRAGVQSTGVDRDRTYHAFERKPIGEALQQLSAVRDGFDFTITPDKTWTIFYPERGQRTDNVFEYEKNIGGYSYDVDASEMANEISLIGGGQDEDTMVAVAQSSSSLDDYGLFQAAIAWKDVRHISTLRMHAREELRLRQLPRQQPQIDFQGDDPPYGGFGVGDYSRLVIHDGYFDVDDQFRIIALTTQLSDEGRESVQVFFEQELVEAS